MPTSDPLSASGAFAAHARSWVDAWNRHDLEAVLSHYAENLLFEAPTVVARWGRLDGILRTRDELRQHFQIGLGRAPDLHFEAESLLLGVTSCALVYRRENGNRVVEVTRLDSAGRANEVHVYYAEPQP